MQNFETIDFKPIDFHNGTKKKKKNLKCIHLRLSYFFIYFWIDFQELAWMDKNKPWVSQRIKNKNTKLPKYQKINSVNC